MPITKLNSFTQKVADLADKPQLTSADFKAKFDAAPDELRLKVNSNVDALLSTTEGDSGANNIGATALNTKSGTTVQAQLEYLQTEVNNVVLGQIPDGSLTSVKLANGSVTSEKLAEGAVDFTPVNRILANHEAWFDIDGRATPNSGKFYDLLDGTNDLSVGKIDLTKTNAVGTLSIGATSIPVESATGFKVGQEVTVYDDVNLERVVISAIVGNTLTVSALVKAYKDKANVARSMCVVDTVNKLLKFGGWDSSILNTVTDKTVVASAYDTSGNGGRKLVRLENGWLVSAVSDTTNKIIYLYKSEDNGSTWSVLCNIQNGTSLQFPNTSLVSNGNIVYVAYLNSATGASVVKIDTTTQTNTNIHANAITIDSNQQATNMISLTINEAKTELHASWASKNTTYPNSFNIRYAKGTINADGSVTWGAVEQRTTNNTSGQDNRNPSLVIAGDKINIICEYQSSTYYEIRTLVYINSSWNVKAIHGISSYTQSSPSAGFVPQSINGLASGRIWVAWHGTDSTDTTQSNIRVSYSDDGGATWSAMQKLTVGNTYAQQFPSITTSKNNETSIVWQGHVDAYMDIRKIKNIAGVWGSIVNVKVSSTVHLQFPSTLSGTNLSFDEPLFIYQDGGGKVGFYGTWTIGSTTPILENDVRYNITPSTLTNEVVTWVERDKGDITLTGAVSIVDTVANESYSPMTKSTVTIDVDTEEDQFVGSVATAEERVTLKLNLKRTATTANKAITKVLGAVG